MGAGNKFDPARLDFVNPISATQGGTGSVTFTVLSNTASLNFPSILAATSADLTIALTGAVANDAVVLGLPIDQDPSLTAEAFVSAPDVVTVRAHNVGSIAVDQSAKTYRVTVLRA